MKNEIWVDHKDTLPEDNGHGLTRRVLAYSDDLMVVENTFEKGAVAGLHHHPHTQISYIVSGKFEFTVDGEKHVVSTGDSFYMPGSAWRPALSWIPLLRTGKTS